MSMTDDLILAELRVIHVLLDQLVRLTEMALRHTEEASRLQAVAMEAMRRNEERLEEARQLRLSAALTEKGTRA